VRKILDATKIANFAGDRLKIQVYPPQPIVDTDNDRNTYIVDFLDTAQTKAEIS